MSSTPVARLAFLCLAMITVVARPLAASPCQPWIRGDANADGEVDISDPLRILGFAFLGDAAPPCLAAADANSQGGTIDLSDVIFILNHLFLGAAAPAAPYPECGLPGESSPFPCESYPPCEALPDCDDPDPLLVEEGPAPEELPPVPSLDVPGTMVAGELFDVALSGLGPYGPGEIEWGDGTRTSVLADGVFPHVYLREGEAVISFVDSQGEVLVETSVSVAPAFAVVDVAIYPAALLDEESGFVPLEGEACVIPPEMFPEFEGTSEPCARFLPGMTGPTVAVEIHARGEGTVLAELVLETEDGEEALVGVIEEETPAGGGPVVAVVGPLPTEVFPGSVRFWVDVTGTDADLGAPHVAFHYQVLALAPPPAGGGGGIDPRIVDEQQCQQLQAAHQQLRGQLDRKKNDCDNLRDALARAQEALAKTNTALDTASAERDATQSRIDDLESQARDLRNYITGTLGPTATLVTGGPGAAPAGSNYVGAYGVGLAFGDAQALLDRASAFSPSPLEAVNQLGQTSQKIQTAQNLLAAQNGHIAQLAGQAAALAQQIADLEQQLADCERDVRDMEERLTELEDDHQECLRLLKLKRLAEQAIRDASRSTRSGSQDQDRLEDEVTGTSDLVGSRAGSDAQTAASEDDVRSASAQGDAADRKLARARRLLADARRALREGDFEEARAFAEEAKRCAGEAADIRSAARAILHRTRADAARRPRRQCQNGDTKTSGWRESVVWVGASSVQIVPHLQDPEEWNAWLATVEGSLDEIATFMTVANTAFLAVRAGTPIATGAPLRVTGNFEPFADMAVGAIFRAYSRLAEAIAGVDVWILAEGRRVRERTHYVCVDGLWAVDWIERVEDEETFFEAKMLGTAFARNREEREAQCRDILSQGVRNLLGH